MQSYISYEFCDWNNPIHTTAFLDLLNHYMLDPMGDHPPLNNEKQINLEKGLQNHPTAEVMLMKEYEKYVGMATVFVNFSTFNVKPYLYIHDVVILDECRGKGYGKALIRELIEISKKRGYCKLTLEVREDNPAAQKVYRGLGFEDVEPKMYFWTKKL